MSGTDGGKPATRRMSFSWVHSSKVRTTSSVGSGSHRLYTVTPAGGSGSCLACSRVASTAARQPARVAAGLRPASRSAAGWVDAT